MADGTFSRVPPQLWGPDWRKGSIRRIRRWAVTDETERM